jgi:cobalt/nickel transport system permease protein
VAWGALVVPHLWDGARATPDDDRRSATRPALVAAIAFGFLLTALKLPSVAGSSAHPTGLALGTLLIGPRRMAAVALGILVLQALLLAHGGLTTLGANVWSLGVAGPWVAWWSWRGLRAAGVRSTIAVGVAAALADLATYAVTAGQLALAHGGELGGFGAAFVSMAGIFALTQLPIALLEGALTATAWRALTGGDAMPREVPA